MKPKPRRRPLNRRQLLRKKSNKRLLRPLDKPRKKKLNPRKRLLKKRRHLRR